MKIVDSAIGGGSDSLSELLARIAQQDSAAFSGLYHRTSAKIYGVIVGILGRGPAAEEVMQDAYLKVWRRAGDFDASRASPIAWLAAIARNSAIDVARRATPPMAEFSDETQIAGEAVDPLASREKSEDLRALLTCLDGLDPEKRQIVLLAYCRGLSREALSARFAAPVATIKTWLHRSLAQLKICLAQ